MHRFTRFALLMVIISPLGAQTTYSLSVPSNPVSPGSTVDIPININTPLSVIQPAALQFTVNYTAADISAISLKTGQSSDTANKSIYCNILSPGKDMCLIVGINTNLIANGSAAVISLTISPTIKVNSTSISLTNNLGATLAGDGITISDLPFVGVGIVPSKCDLNSDFSIDAVDVLIAVNQTLGIQTCSTADLNGDGKCTLTEVQWIVEAALGQACRLQ